MVFASLVFLCLFLPLNLLLYYVFKNNIYRNILLIVFSLFFYAWGEPVWVSLLIFTTFIDYFNAIVVDKFRGRIWAKVAVISSLIFNLGILMAFKYSGFIYENINAVFGTTFQIPQFSLPIGISFYTFQSVSYVLDVYRGEVPAQKQYYKFLLFVSLFHQLVAGPIVRYVDIAAEIDNRKIKWDEVSQGITRFCTGLFKKVFFANTAGELATKYLDGDFSHLTTAGAWTGLFLFSLQIYFDFSGYSDMAIGMGKMIGFHYHENFRFPYVSRSATEFWRRWHISLGSFFRDYVYIPMGGNQKRMYFNLLVVWFLTGLWHGASWNFILWGLYFGFFIAIEKLFLQKILGKIGFLSNLYLILVAMIGWALFYYTDLHRLYDFSRILIGQTQLQFYDLELQITLGSNFIWILFAILFCMPLKNVMQSFLEHRSTSIKNLAISAEVLLNVLMLVVSVSLLVGKSYNPFLYFRF
ncbi:MAG: MBOAT family protein [Bacteroidetes bacterium]|nr:MBOAT family protein [Bacteroidota bacterium]